MEAREFVWDHFKLNAEQRMQGFNFFVAFSIFANGGVFAAFEKEIAPVLICVVGIFVAVLSVVFYLVDTRSRNLLRLTIPALKEIEAQFPESHRLFAIDAAQQGKLFRYTTGIRILLAMQFLFGLGVAIYGFCRWVF